MKLVVLCIGELRELDTRIVRLAEFLGVPCETIALANVAEHVELQERNVSDQRSCFVVTAQTMEEWVGSDGLSAELVTFLLSRFTHLVVHGLRVDSFDSKLVRALSDGRLNAVEANDGESLNYEIDKDSRDICGAFAGLSFGPVNPANDHVLSLASCDQKVRQLISIGGQPFMALVKTEGAEVIFVASESIADIGAEVGDAPMTAYFSKFVPQVMALRYAAGDECWRPSNAYASIIIDDPLLKEHYGFLEFDSLLRLTKEHTCHCTIAFIPHNFSRNSARIISMFCDNAAELSICFHGNDHTQGEFASTDRSHLNALLRVAEDRMGMHRKRTGLTCDKVMVFPQGGFSVEAMEVLKVHDFYASVNTIPYPAQSAMHLTIADLAQPAVLRYGGFPLFIRKPARQLQEPEVAFEVFFGRPVLIVTHHDAFEHPEQLIDAVTRISSVAPEVEWCNLAAIVSNSSLKRLGRDGMQHVRAFSGTTQIFNASESIQRYSIEWDSSFDGTEVEAVAIDGTPCRDFEVSEAGIRITAELVPGASQTFSLIHRKDQSPAIDLGVRWKLKAFLRRRLSEFRDNYLSKSPRALEAAKAFQRRFLRV